MRQFSSMMAERRWQAAAAVGAAAVLVLVAAVFTASQSSSSLLSRDNALLRAEEQVVRDKARVARDVNTLQRIMQQKRTPQFRQAQLRAAAFARRLPQLSVHGGLSLENPDMEFTRTPRVQRREGEPPFRYGPNKRYCPGGNCENLDNANVVTDRWPTDIYSSVPWMGFDPDASPERNRAINQREGEFAKELRPDTYHPPVEWGVGGLEGKGTVYKEDRGYENMKKAGVLYDEWPTDIYRGVPYPGWDRTQFDHEARQPRMPHRDPLKVAEETQQSNAPLQNAGVKVNRLPTDTTDRVYNQVDGMLDQLVPVQDTPRWREKGVASQEKPSHFLLNDNTDLTAPQPKPDHDLGFEVA